MATLAYRGDLAGCDNFNSITSQRLPWLSDKISTINIKREGSDVVALSKKNRKQGRHGANIRPMTGRFTIVTTNGATLGCHVVDVATTTAHLRLRRRPNPNQLSGHKNSLWNRQVQSHSRRANTIINMRRHLIVSKRKHFPLMAKPANQGSIGIFCWSFVDLHKLHTVFTIA